MDSLIVKVLFGMGSNQNTTLGNKSLKTPPIHSFTFIFRFGIKMQIFLNLATKWKVTAHYVTVFPLLICLLSNTR